jgi:hypothetical protein
MAAVASYIIFYHEGAWLLSYTLNFTHLLTPNLIRHIVVCRRGVRDAKYGDLFTAGGAVDEEESLVAAVRRETIEEFGITLPEKAYIPFMTIGSLTVFIAVLSARPTINGPSKRHAWELLQTQIIPSMPNNAGTRLTCVPLLTAISHASGIVREIMERVNSQYSQATPSTACV